MVAWDEYSIDANPEGFEEDCKKAKESWGDDLLQWRMVELKTNGGDIDKLFETPVVSATVE